MHDMFDSVDSTGVGALVSVFVPLYKHEGVDLALSQEDEKFLTCSRPLALVAASDAADYHIFFTGMSVMLLTLAAFGVVDRISNKNVVFLPPKLVIIRGQGTIGDIASTPSTQVIVICGTYVNHLTVRKGASKRKGAL
jgi:hypothetical protein